MLTELCAELRNYFVVSIHEGTFTIDGGKIAPLDFIQENQYFRIVGSVFNDGVYQNTADLVLTDEIFSGSAEIFLKVTVTFPPILSEEI